MPPVANVGSTITCSFGQTGVLGGVSTVLVEGTPALTVMDAIPMVNIMPMGMCISVANPMGMGKPPPPAGPGPTPIACIPIPITTWVPPMAPTKLVMKKPVLTQGSTCTCQWAGVITIAKAATKTIAQ
ncbi:MAG TPA: DUF4280 domain-containing protein [Vicinamibacterales bacterium]